VVRSLPLSASQSRAVLSHEAVSTRWPSGLETALTTNIGVAFESGQKLAALGLPEPRGTVVRGGEHPPVVRAKDRGPNPSGVALKSVPLLLKRLLLSAPRFA
jgi:hypothetical protein